MEHYYAKFAINNFYHIYNRANTDTGQTFYQEKNYAYFLKKFDQYLSDYLEVWAYCLLPNHFHFLVKIKKTDGVNTAAISNDSISVIRNTMKTINVVVLNDIIDRIQQINSTTVGDDTNVISAIKKIDTVTLTNTLNTMNTLINRIDTVKNSETISNHVNVVEEQFRKFFLSYAKAINKQESRRGNLFQKRFKRIHVDNDNYLMTLIHYIHHNPIHHHLTQNIQNWHYNSYNTLVGQADTKLMRTEVLELFGNKDRFIEFHQMLTDYNSIKPYVVEE